VKDIENDDYTHGLALIYIRGYLRSYARLVGTSPNNVIDVFEMMNLEKEFKRAKSGKEKIMFQPTVPVFSKKTRYIRRWRAVRWISGGVILILLVLIAMWWQGQRKYALYPTKQAKQVQLQSQLSIRSIKDAGKAQAKAPNQMAISEQSEQQEK
jgi:hypothetical protein